MTEVDLYINFVLHAIYGRLGEADQLMRVAGTNIQRVAGVLRQKHPIEPKPIYRGMLLDPDQHFELDGRLTFLSWSEDRDVACWFADPRSTISAPLAESNPKLRGHLVTLAASTRVLFHHSWAQAFGNLATLALMHPFMGEEGRRQIEWSLQTQQEVITGPIAGITPKLVDNAPSLFDLERKLTPVWVAETEGYAS